MLDKGLAIFFPGPNSFTGEDVLELHGHGSPVLLKLLLQEINTLGVRQANPGEFSQRAFLNNKIDLVQAEAIADIIDSQSETACPLGHALFEWRIFQIRLKALLVKLFIYACMLNLQSIFPKKRLILFQVIL